MHLGMSGSFRVIKPDNEAAPGEFHYPRGKDSTHDHVLFRMSSGADIVFNDPRRFGYMKVIARNALEDEPLLRDLGPEPLGNEFDAAMLARSCEGKTTSLKAALLDQRVVAGLGNIYVCEALYRAGIDPRKPAGKVSLKALARLVDAIRDVLREAIEAGGSSLRDYARPDGELGYFSKRFAVYDREGEPCGRGDGGTIGRIAQGGRSTWYCARCQR